MLKEDADVSNMSSDFLHHDSSLWSRFRMSHMLNKELVEMWEQAWLGALEAGIDQPEERTASWDEKTASTAERREALPSLREEGPAVNPCKQASLMAASEGKPPVRFIQQRLVPLARSVHVCGPRTGVQTPAILTYPVGGRDESRSYFAKGKRKSRFSYIFSTSKERQVCVFTLETDWWLYPAHQIILLSLLIWRLYSSFNWTTTFNVLPVQRSLKMSFLFPHTFTHVLLLVGYSCRPTEKPNQARTDWVQV